LGEVVEEGDPVGVPVVLGGAVGRLDDEAAGGARQQGQCVVAGDRVRLDGRAQQRETLAEAGLPERGVPLEVFLAAPDVVDDEVEVSR
jgi:hypothetical protein